MNNIKSSDKPDKKPLEVGSATLEEIDPGTCVFSGDIQTASLNIKIGFIIITDLQAALKTEFSSVLLLHFDDDSNPIQIGHTRFTVPSELGKEDWVIELIVEDPFLSTTPITLNLEPDRRYGSDFDPEHFNDPLMFWSNWTLLWNR